MAGTIFPKAAAISDPTADKAARVQTARPNALRLFVATLLVLIVGGAYWSQLPGTQYWTAPSRRDRKIPSLDAEKVTYLADASRGKSRWLAKYEQTGSGIRAKGTEIPAQEHDFERLILALLPIRQEEKESALQVPGYEITMMVGNRGVEIRVGFKAGADDDEMLIEYFGRYYSGGNSTEFKAIAESLLKRSK